MSKENAADIEPRINLINLFLTRQQFDFLKACLKLAEAAVNLDSKLLNGLTAHLQEYNRFRRESVIEPVVNQVNLITANQDGGKESFYCPICDVIHISYHPDNE